jgi:ribosomal protein S13
MRTIGRVAKMQEKILQCNEFTVNISHDINRAVEQITYKTFRHTESKLHVGRWSS